MSSSTRRDFGLLCCICFEFLTPDRCHVGLDGQKWDVCPGQCAIDAGIPEGPARPAPGNPGPQRPRTPGG